MNSMNPVTDLKIESYDISTSFCTSLIAISNAISNGISHNSAVTIIFERIRSSVNASYF